MLGIILVERLIVSILNEIVRHTILYIVKQILTVCMYEWKKDSKLWLMYFVTENAAKRKAVPWNGFEEANELDRMKFGRLACTAAN